MIIFDSQELERIIQIVSLANNTDDIPAHSWARASKVLLAEVERLHSELAVANELLEIKQQRIETLLNERAHLAEAYSEKIE